VVPDEKVEHFLGMSLDRKSLRQSVHTPRPIVARRARAAAAT
jgi:hypothetical protein